MHWNEETEREDFAIAFAAKEYKFALDDLDNWLRALLKYDGDLAVEKQKVLKEVRNKLHEICKERGLL